MEFRLVSEPGHPGAIVRYAELTGKPIKDQTHYGGLGFRDSERTLPAKVPSCNELAARIDALEQRLARLEKKP
jgi:hypothetical protein